MPENTLLGFVMGLVHDPAAAAAYRLNPERAIAEADLDGVTASDIDDLIPMVSETRQDGFGLSNPDRAIWSGGDVVQSFDAFDAPAMASESPYSDVATFDQLDSMQVISTPDQPFNGGPGLFEAAPDPAFPVPDPVSNGPLTEPDDFFDASGPGSVYEPSETPLESPAFETPPASGTHDGLGDLPDWGPADNLDL